MADLFDQASGEKDTASGVTPLAERLRPASLDEVIGQEHLLGPEGPLRTMLTNKTLGSVIFWGPPGVGKTTLAKLLATEVNLAFVQISAIFTGVADLKKIFEAARLRRQNGRGTLLFVDEIHRFNKSQQDGFLPHMENGTIVLVGATTENPSFELNSALLSRSQVLVLERLTLAELELLAQRAERAMGRKLPLTAEARDAVLDMADGDGRALLNLLEQCFSWQDSDKVDTETMGRRLSKRMPNYDKSGDEHYNLISALHKSVRGSDPDAALYWFARMLNGGEDPRYLARRITRMAVEDIGLADPQAQAICLQSWQTYERLGSPEGELGAEIQGRLCRILASAAGREEDRIGTAAETYPERADRPDEGSGLRRGLSVRSRSAGRVFRPELFSGGDGAWNLLSARGSGLRARTEKAGGIFRQTPVKAERECRINHLYSI
jgi:putative ATPase